MEHIAYIKKTTFFHASLEYHINSCNSIAISSDKFNWDEKHKKTYFTYEQRKQLLESVRYVDLVIPEENWEQKISDVKEFRVDTFVMGSDWEGKFDFLKPYCDVVYLPRTPEISSTQIKQDLHK